jgi:signal transduction histidine kinase
MNAMNQVNEGHLRKQARFVMKRERFSHLICPNRSKCKERKNGMIHNRKLCTPQERTVAFIDHHPQTLFGVANVDRATLQLVAQQSERKRIARELHDTLLQGFTAVALKLSALTSSLPPALSKTKEQLEKTLEQIDQYLTEARRSIWKLRSSARESTEDFSKALSKVSERALTGTGIELSFSVCGVARKIKSAFEDNLLRICEEAVANAAKHARPTQVEVTFEFNSKDVQLRIRDNGRGFDPARAGHPKDGHFGLLGMKERVEVLSGMLSIDTAPKRGTILLVTIPTDETERRNARENCHEH